MGFQELSNAYKKLKIVFDEPNVNNICKVKGERPENTCYSCSNKESATNKTQPICIRCSSIHADGIEDSNVAYQKLEVKDGNLSKEYCDMLPNNVSNAYNFSKIAIGKVD